jgi:hypothetical protein
VRVTNSDSWVTNLTHFLVARDDVHIRPREGNWPVMGPRITAASVQAFKTEQNYIGYLFYGCGDQTTSHMPTVSKSDCKLNTAIPSFLMYVEQGLFWGANGQVITVLGSRVQPELRFREITRQLFSRTARLATECCETGSD